MYGPSTYRVSGKKDLASLLATVKEVEAGADRVWGFRPLGAEATSERVTGVRLAGIDSGDD
jgi:hypothetical protein